MKTERDFAEVHEICSEHQVTIRELKPIAGSFGKRIFIINQELLLRVSETPMTLEHEKFRRVATLDFVPKIVHTGILERKAGPFYYTLLTLLPGADFVAGYHETTEAQQKQLAEDTAEFLNNLQALSGTHYDIGLYVPALPHFSGTWRDGHRQYWDLLKQDAARSHLKPDSIRVFERTFQFLDASAAALDFQTGPKLLHNDLHPRNILVHQGRFSGVIDWECSQFGEADFELCHLIHWCLYPPEPTIDFRPFLQALFAAAPKCTLVPDLARRLAIYQVEHEMQQTIWHGRDAESWRVPRLVRWMEGGVDDLFREITVTENHPIRE